MKDKKIKSGNISVLLKKIFLVVSLILFDFREILCGKIYIQLNDQTLRDPKLKSLRFHKTTDKEKDAYCFSIKIVFSKGSKLKNKSDKIFNIDDCVLAMGVGFDYEPEKQSKKLKEVRIGTSPTNDIDLKRLNFKTIRNTEKSMEICMEFKVAYEKGAEEAFADSSDLKKVLFHIEMTSKHNCDKFQTIYVKEILCDKDNPFYYISNGRKYYEVDFLPLRDFIVANESYINIIQKEYAESRSSESSHSEESEKSLNTTINGEKTNEVKKLILGV